MSYSTQTDLLNRISEDDLIGLTDKTDAGEIDTTIVTRAIADADAEIDGYCGSRYTLPFSPVPVMIRKLSVDIAMYNLYGLNPTLEIPEEIQARYDNAVRFLRDVSSGRVSLGVDAPAEPETGLPQATTDKSDRIFTLGKKSAGSAGSLDNY